MFSKLLNKIRNLPGWKKTGMVMGAAAFLVTFLAMVNPWYFLAYNATDSLGGYVFLIKRGEMPDKGEKAAFYPPENRFYPKRMWFVKIVKAVEGDVVEFRDRSLYMDDQYLGWIVDEAKSGDKLEPLAAGAIEIPKDKYFMWTPHGRSFDSRYKDIGLISKDALIGTAYRIF